MNQIKNFFKPTWAKTILFVIFILVAYAGFISSWAFIRDTGIAKPFLYDYLKSFGVIWLLWILLIYPLIMSGQLFNIIVGSGTRELQFMTAAHIWASWIVQTIYFYLLACFIIAIIGFIKKKIAEKKFDDRRRIR